MTAERVLPSAAVAVVLALVVVELGWLPGVRYAWGMTLWQYLPPTVVGGLAAGVLLLCLPAVRARVGMLSAAVCARVPAWPVLVATPVVLWLMRERTLYGDSAILLVNAASGSHFLFPDVGATFLFHASMRLAPAFGVSGQDVLQVLVALAGGVALASFHAAARELAPSPGRAAMLTTIVLGGGLTRVLAGHVEVYGFVLAAAGVWLWATVAHLRGRVGLWMPAVATGGVVWMHLSGIFLVPSLVVLASAGEGGRRVRRTVDALAFAAAPCVVFFAVMLAIGRWGDLEQAVRTMLQWTGVVPSPVGHEAFVRGWLSEEGVGTRYAMFSAAHLKYLANAFFLLCPAALPMLAGFLVRAPRAFVATPEARVLSAACVALLAYSAVVRPVWGPYDWDLFSLPAAIAGTLAGHLLMVRTSRRAAVDLGILVVGATALMVTIPLLAVGIVDVREAGPFGIRTLQGPPGQTPEDLLIRRIGPWL